MATSNNVVLGHGLVYITTTIGTALPADTVAKGTAFGGTWVNVGYTKGVSAKINDERKRIDVDQSTVDVKEYISKNDASITVNMSEVTLANLKYALGQGTLSTTGSTEVLTLGDNPAISEFSIALEGQSPNTSAAFRRVQIYRATPAADVEIVMSREEETVYAVTFNALLYEAGSAGDNLMQVRDYIA